MPRSAKGEFTVQSFKYGLDTRRSELTSQPGTIARLVNGHINQGAEIEKRKAFIKSGFTDVFGRVGSSLVLGTYGLLATPNGLMTFGSSTLANILASSITVSPTGGAVINGDGTGYVTASYPVPGARLIVGSTILISGTGLAALDTHTFTLTVADYNYQGLGYDLYGFSVGGGGASSTTGSFISTNPPTALPSPFLYQQLTDPNEGFALFNVTEIKTGVPSLSNAITDWTIYPSSDNPRSGSVFIGVANPGYAAGDSISITGTGSVLDGGSYALYLVANGPNGELFFYYNSTSSSFRIGTGGTVSTTNPTISITVTGTSTGLVAGSLFTLAGLSSTLAFLNGPQTAYSVSTSGGNTIVLIQGVFNGDVTGSPLCNLSIGNNTGTAMVAVQATCLFNGLPFVVAIFGDGDTGIFYNGALVNDFYNGEVFSNQSTSGFGSNDALATALANYVNSTAGYTASVSGTVVTATSVNPSDTTKATPGGNFTVTAGNKTTAGTTTITPLSNAVAAILGAQATASFTITAVDIGGSGNVTGVFIDSGSSINLLSGNVGSGSLNVSALATAVALNINTTAAIAGISAQSSGGTVTITMPPGSTYNDSALVITVDNKVCIANSYLIINVGTGHSGGSGKLEITSITPSDNGAVNILSSSSIDSSTYATTALYVAALVSNINGHTGTSKYVAAQGPSIGGSTYLYISRQTCQSGDAQATIAVVVGTNTGGGVVAQAVTNQGFTATVSVKSVSSSTTGVQNVGNIPTNTVTAKPIGGVGPFLYQWNYYSGSTDVKCMSPTKATTAFEADIVSGTNSSPYTSPSVNGLRPVGGSVSAKFTCTITDTSPTPNVIAITPPVTVSAAYITAFQQPFTGKT